MAESKEEFYNRSWTFSARVRTGSLTVQHKEGQLNVMKIQVIDRGNKCKIECKGQLKHMPKWANSSRTATFNISGYDTHPPAPEEVLELVRRFAFPKVEL
jgi:hypothetical protein